MTPWALAYGFVVAGLVGALGHVTGGHFNPAVTLAMLLAKQVDWVGAAAYWIAQFVGGIAGAVAIMLATDRDLVRKGTPEINEELTNAGGAIALEAIFTMVIVLVFLGLVLDERAPLSAYPFAVGLTVAAGALATASFTGAWLNPARGLGPSIVSAEWDGMVAWLPGPLIGGVLAWALFSFVISPGTGHLSQRRDAFPEPIPPPPGPSLLP